MANPVVATGRIDDVPWPGTGDATNIGLLKAIYNALSGAATGDSSVYKYAKANVAASQVDSVIVAGVTAKRILVVQFRIIVGGVATDCTFNSKGSGAGVAITELMSFAAHGGVAPGFSRVGHFAPTTAAEALTLTTSAGSTVGVYVVYQEIT